MHPEVQISLLVHLEVEVPILVHPLIPTLFYREIQQRGILLHAIKVWLTCAAKMLRY